MSEKLTQKDGAALMEELLLLTTSMVRQSEDADFLIEGVEKRQAIMDAYDEWAKLNPEALAALEKDTDTIKTAGEILAMDKDIVKALSAFKQEIQKDVTASKAQQKVMGYLAGAISSSGSYMDVKLT